MQKARGHPSSGLPQLVSIRFQVLFTPLIGVLFIIQSPYWFTIGRPGVLSLGGWTPHIHAEFHEHRATLGLASYCSTGLSPSVVDLSRSFTQLLVYPFSLAATYGVAFCFPFLRLLRCFSSPGSLPYPMHSGMDDPRKRAGFPHSEILGSKPGYRLPEAYRRFQRPSSPLDAKTSTVCPLVAFSRHPDPDASVIGNPINTFTLGQFGLKMHGPK